MFRACTVFRFYGAVFFACSEHKNKQDDDKERKCRKNGGINNFFHVKNNDFCSGTHRVTSRLSGCRFTAIRFFYKCMFGKEKYACYLRDKGREIL